MLWWAGAELANILNEAALEAVRRGGSIITTEDVYNGMDRILQVPSHPVSDENEEVCIASRPLLAAGCLQDLPFLACPSQSK